MTRPPDKARRLRITPSAPELMPTGIGGFDALLGGGLPRNRTTLVVGSPGCGKTLFALQTLVKGARELDEPGIFVAFEETAERLISNSASLGWDVGGLKNKLFVIDARLPNGHVRGGEFDFLGLLAAVGAKQKQMGARRIVFDGIDLLLGLLDDRLAERREMRRLCDWLSEQGLTGLITCKTEEGAGTVDRTGYLQSLADCVVRLQNKLVGSVPVRLLRVTKCRGQAHVTGEVPFAITPTGLKVLSYRPTEPERVTSQRISTGVPALDDMLSGGYFRGSSVLVSGSPGTAKSTLAGVFIAAAARRGEPSLYVAFDEVAGQVVRNLAAVGVRLAPHVKSGVLQVVSERKLEKNPVEYVAHILELIETHGVRCLVVDPISALSGAGVDSMAEELVVRLLDFACSRGMTVLCTCTRGSSLLGNGDGLMEEGAAGVSSIADTWVHLTHVVQRGQRHRALAVVKARGIAHSNQVRELLLSRRGVVLGSFVEPIEEREAQPPMPRGRR